MKFLNRKLEEDFGLEFMILRGKEKEEISTVYNLGMCSIFS